MDGITKMLYSPTMDKVLAELEDYQGTKLGDLLGFMQAFNLRFGPARSYRQRLIYQRLYPMLADQATALDRLHQRRYGGRLERRDQRRESWWRGRQDSRKSRRRRDRRTQVCRHRLLQELGQMRNRRPDLAVDIARRVRMQ